MKYPLLLITCLVIPQLFGQKTEKNEAKNQVFNNFDFNEGGYSLLGIFYGSDRNSLQDSLGQFFTNDIDVLNDFKSKWVFEKSGKRFACGYHYTVLLCKNGMEIASFYINLNCEELVTNGKCYYFNPNLIRQFYDRLHFPIRRDYKFASLSEGREFHKQLMLDSNLIWTETPEWLKYEGSFEFTYLFPEGTIKEYKDENETDVIIKRIKEEIEQYFPNESFELEERGGSSTEIFLEVKCNKSLSDQFNLYNRDINSPFQKWNPYECKWKAYFITNFKIKR